MILLAIICSLLANFALSDIVLNEGVVSKISIDGNVTRIAHYIGEERDDINYIILEIHCQVYNVTLSTVYDFNIYDETVKGRDIGIITKYPDTSVNTVYWFVKTSSLQAVNTLMLVTYIAHAEPIPGGCNQIMNLENDANLLLYYTKYWTSVHYQWANTASEKECESSTAQKSLEYDIYVYFMKEASLGEEHYMDAVKKMIGKENIMKNGRKILTMANDMRTLSNFTISSSEGQGVIYSIIVRQTALDTSASYISMASYNCDLFYQTCNIYIGSSEYVIGALCTVVGLILCFFGHHYFKLELFIFGFLSFTIIFFLLFSIYTPLGIQDVFILLLLSSVCGIVGGLLGVGFWWYFGIPVLSVLFIGLVGGYLFSAIVFFTPFGNLTAWETEFNYWMAFTCGVLLYPLIFLCFTKTLNILTCAFVGSFLLCVFLDILLQTTLKLIILNNLNKAIIKDYIKVEVVTPFQMNDIILVCTWFVLLVIGVLVQFKQSKGRAPFPPCPRILRKRRIEQEMNRRRAMEDFDNERQPLLHGNDPPPSYSEISPERQELNQPT